MRIWQGPAAAFGAVLLSSCSGLPSVEKEIATFHKLLDAENYGEIWRDSTPEMQEASGAAELTKFLGAVHRKLGKVVRSRQVGWNTNVNTSGSFAQVQMETTFERGTGTETFVYRKVGEEMKLQGYNINSQDMMVN